MDLGQQRRGVDMGPSALRYAGLQARLQRLGYDVHDGGNIDVAAPEEATGEEALKVIGDAPVRHLHAVLSACQSIYQTAAACVLEHNLPIFMGGDHAIAMGTIGGVSTAAVPA